MVFAAALSVAAIPAQADTLAADCKAHPPNEAANDTAGITQFCACIDKETVGNDAVRAEFAKTWPMPDVASRKAAMNAAANAIADKCAPHH